MYKASIFVVMIFTFALPAFAAQKPQTVGDIFQGFSEGNLAGLIPTIVGVGVVTFLAGVLSFVRAGDNEEKRTQGQKVMVFGIIVLFVMISYWAIVAIFTQSFFGEQPALPNYLPRLMTQ